MADIYDVQIKVISQKGECSAGHKVGDTWVMGAKAPEGLCASALHSIFPEVRVLRFGGSMPWEKDKDATCLACSDPLNPVVFEVRRIR